jgi:hypothetical protein
MSRLRDFLSPKGDPVQVILKRKGKPVASIYKDEKQEIRSPALQKDKQADEPSDHNS